MLKNFGKFKQWTGERLGAAKATLQTGGFQQLEDDTEKKRAGFEKVHEATEQVYGQLSKKKPSIEDAKAKCLPWESLASCWISHGSTFPDDNALGVALINLGQTEARVALLQEDFANTIKDEYMDVLKQGLQHYKEYDTLKKKLESRRLDYDAKLTRLHKSKKEKPEWGQEMQTAKTKYDESESDVIQKMITLQEYEFDHCNALSQLMEAQLTYYQRCVELISELRDHMPSPEARPITTPTTRFFANDSTHSLLTPTNDRCDTDNPLNETLPTPDPALKSSQQPAGSRKSSIDSINRLRRLPSHPSASIYNNDDQLQRRQTPSSTKQTPPPVVPRRKCNTPSKTHRKAIFNFQRNGVDELSFSIGDVITVIEPVDEGWWMGEMEQIEPKRKGIFPVNYTEDIMPARPTTPSRPPPLMKKYIPQEQEDETQHGNVDYTQIQQDTSPFNDSPSSPQPSTPAFRPKPANVPSKIGTPLTPLTRSSLFASRESTHSTALPPPPPPPPLHSFALSNKPVSSTETRTPPPHPSSRTKTVSIPSQRIETTPATNCKECGCDDYSANLFKKGHCNNCFHEHPL
ncbi:unnamed protein product [Absidia cylindrospora]